MLQTAGMRSLTLQASNVGPMTIANTTEASIFNSTIAGTRTIPANWFQPGFNARFVVRGVATTPLIAGITTVRIKVGSTTIATAVTGSLLGSLTAMNFSIVGNIQCYTTGTSGTFGVGGEVRYPAGLAGFQMGTAPLTASGVSFNTTVDQTFDLTVQWGTTGHTLRADIAYLELMAMV